jgi:hypothetical protein
MHHTLFPYTLCITLDKGVYQAKYQHRGGSLFAFLSSVFYLFTFPSPSGCSKGDRPGSFFFHSTVLGVQMERYMART